MTLEEQKANLLSDMHWDMVIWRLAMVPQLLFLFAVAICFAVIAAVGVWTTIVYFRENPDSFKRIMPYLVGGSSSVLGIPLYKIVPLLLRQTGIFVRREHDYTAFFGRARNCSTNADLQAVLAAYRTIR